MPESIYKPRKVETDWARNCTCGHGEAEHRSSGSKALGSTTRGVCLAKGCDCNAYTYPHTRKEAA